MFRVFVPIIAPLDRIPIRHRHKPLGICSLSLRYIVLAASWCWDCGKIFFFKFYSFRVALIKQYSTQSCVFRQYFWCVEDFNSFLVEILLTISIYFNLTFMSRFGRFFHFVESLSAHLDIKVVGETWIQYEMIGLYNIPGFRAYFSCRNGALLVQKWAFPDKILKISI